MEGQSLGDILSEALKEKETKMRVYDCLIGINSNSKKIEAIKCIRGALGIGLGEAKTLVEACDFNWSYRANVRISDAQLGRFAALTLRPENNSAANPCFSLIEAVEVVEKKPDYDYSAVTL